MVYWNSRLFAIGIVSFYFPIEEEATSSYGPSLAIPIPLLFQQALGKNAGRF
jgi:hypothetical protein